MAHRCAAHAWRAIRARPTGANGQSCRQPLRSACARSGLTPMNRCVRWRVCRVGVGPTRSRFDGRPQWHSVPASHGMIWMGAASPPSCGTGGVRGRQRSAISMSAWDGPSRRAAHAQTGPGVRSERYLCRRICSAAASHRAAAARSGIIGLTIRDSSRCHRMAVGIRRMRGRLSAAKPLGSSLSCDDLDGCCLSAKLREWWRPWPTAKRHFRRPHGTALRGERRMGCPDLACDPSNIYVGASAAMLRAAAQPRQGPESSD